MFRKLFPVFILCISLTAFAQYTTPVVPVVAATPGITYASPQPTAGISSAGRAGISDTSPTTLVTPLNSSTVVYVTDTAVMPVTSPAAAATPANATESAAPASIDFAPWGAGDSAVEAESGPSLGEVAAGYKARRGTQNARTYTNADIQKLGGNRISLGNAGNGISAANHQAAIQDLLARNSQPANPADQTAPTTQTMTPTAPPPTSSPSATNSAAGQNSQATASETTTGTTPQINRQQSQPENGTENSSLPATSTWLPLLGMLGLASGGVGLLARRFRK